MIDPAWFALNLSPFNRTSVELKLELRREEIEARLAFNRTSVELKQALDALFYMGVVLLIEPVWN